jgi:hypothetical protein
LKDCAQLTLLQQSSAASLDGWIALCKWSKNGKTMLKAGRIILGPNIQYADG